MILSVLRPFSMPPPPQQKEKWYACNQMGWVSGSGYEKTVVGTGGATSRGSPG